MKKWWVLVALLVGLTAAPAEAKVVGIGASPNPAALRDWVRFTVQAGTPGRLDVWVSASGFQAPASGTLPGGTWAFECCPGQTAGTPAWHYRSYGTVTPGSYRFNAVAKLRGTFLTTAAMAGGTAGVWVSVR